MANLDNINTANKPFQWLFTLIDQKKADQENDAAARAATWTGTAIDLNIPVFSGVKPNPIHLKQLVQKMDNAIITEG
jgi:hypothetical protein